MHESVPTYGESIHIESETFVIRFKWGWINSCS